MGRSVCTDKEIQNTIVAINSLPSIFGEIIAYYREKNHWTQLNLADLLQVSDRYIQRIEESEITIPKTNIVIALYIVFKLDTACCMNLISKSGNLSFFSVYSAETVAYLKIINSAKEHDLKYWNAYLKSIKLKPLTKPRAERQEKKVKKDKAIV